MPLGGMELLIILFILLAMALSAIPIWFLWRIFEQTGMSGPLALIYLVPFGSVIVLGILAFARWPILDASAGATAETAATSMTIGPAVSVDAAWLPDPLEVSRLRYWDGVAWTEHVAE